MLKVLTVAKKENINKAVNYFDGILFKTIESGGVGAFLVGAKEELEDLIDRSIEQNDKEHAMMTDIHRDSVIRLPGKRIVLSEYDFEECKALLVMWFARDMELAGTPLPRPPRNIIDPISGERISIRPSTKTFGKKKSSDFIEWLYATGSESGVKWSEKALECYQEYRQAK